MVHHHSASTKRSAFFGTKEKPLSRSQENQSKHQSKSDHSSLKTGRSNSLDNPNNSTLKQNHLLKLSFLNSPNSPLNQVSDCLFHDEAKKIYNKISQSYFSPLSSHESSCEDLSSVKPNFADTTSDNCEFDSSFKDLNIPFLDNCAIKKEPEDYDEIEKTTKTSALSLATQLAIVKVKIEKDAKKQPTQEKLKESLVKEPTETQNMQSIISNLQHAIQEQNGLDKDEAKRMLDNLNEFICKKGIYIIFSTTSILILVFYFRKRR